ncbi:MAG: VWA domain-containing protein [Actinomycetota bacterium]|nr:VWA domain-containing protein [Actinomycetota bacterium]
MTLGHPQRTPEQAIISAAVGLARALREFGLSASVDAEHTFLRALAEIDVRERAQVFWAGHAAFVHAPDEFPIFEAVFERFWEGRPLILEEASSEHGESDARMQGSHHGGEALPQFGGEARQTVPLDGDPTRGMQDIPTADGDDGRSNQQRGILAAWSDEETLSRRQNLEYQEDELLALRLLAQEIKRQAPARRSRRAKPSPDGHRFDVRGTIRESMATDGEAFHLAFTAPTLRPRRLLFLCDVSGSMERYSRVLLASLKAAVGAARRAEAFVFATRLTRLTKSLDGRDLEQALDKARAAVPDWSGGTRIGQAMSDFNTMYGRRGYARGAIVLVVSDGWDRGDPKILETEVRRLQLQSRRLVWINPRPMAVDQQPLAIGMRAAMPYIDDFVPGHDPRAVAGLAQLIGGLASDRPMRKVVADGRSTP